jgi:hypothetical protein
MRVTKAQFRKLTRKPTIRRRLTPPKFAPVVATFDFPVWTLVLPLVVVSEANQREFWAKKYRRKIKQQSAVDTAWRFRFDRRPAAPAMITLTRLGGRRMDSDNLAGAFKHIRDQIARILGVDDGSDLLTWRYAQEPGGPRGIRIEIEEGA